MKMTLKDFLETIKNFSGFTFFFFMGCFIFSLMGTKMTASGCFICSLVVTTLVVSVLSLIVGWAAAIYRVYLIGYAGKRRKD